MTDGAWNVIPLTVAPEHSRGGPVVVRAWFRVLGGREMRKTCVLVVLLALTFVAIGCVSKWSRQGWKLEVGPSAWEVEVDPGKVVDK